MKPDKSGTLTEQRLYKANWVPKGEKEKQCNDCAHLEFSCAKNSKGSPRCGKLGCRTGIRATCDKWTKATSRELRGSW